MSLQQHRRALRFVSAAAVATSLAALLSSCASDVTAPDAGVRQVVVTPKNATRFANKTVQFTAVGLDAGGVAVPGLVFTWAVDSVSLASVSATGLLQPTGKRGIVSVTARTVSGQAGGTPVSLIMPATSLTVVEGGRQTGVVGQALPQPIVVVATDGEGVGVAGIAVTFTAPAGASISAATATTDMAGRASVTATLATAAGPQIFSASAEGLTATTTETAKADAPATLAIVSGNAQADTVHKPLPAPFVVNVSDKYGNGVPGAGVSWNRVGAGSLASSAAVTTDNGQASATYVLGDTPGNESVTATAAGVAVGATFSVRTIASVPDAIVVVAGNDQVAAALAPFAKTLTVRVNDARGYSVAGAPVLWSANNASLSSSSTTTNAAGETTVGVVAGSAAGTASVAATSGARSVAFSLFVGASSPARIVFRTQPQNAITRTTMAPIQVAVVDAGGNPTLSNTGLRIEIAPGTASPVIGLSGSTGQPAVNGVVTFSDLSINLAATGVRLLVTAPFLSGVSPATSAPFDVTETPIAVTVVSITQLRCPILGGSCTSAPANLQNAADELDVRVSVDGLIQSATAVLRCGADSLISTAYTNPNQTLVDIPVPTTLFNESTGAVKFKNGGCTLRTTASPLLPGAQVISRTPPIAVTLNNTDVLFGRVSVKRFMSTTDNYLSGPLTITALPLLYSGRTATSATIGVTASGATSSPLPAPTTKTGAPFVVTIPLAGVTAKNIGFTGSVQLSGGSLLTEFVAVSVLSEDIPSFNRPAPWNVDNQSPRAGVFPLGWNTQRNSQAESADGAFLGASFVFAATNAAGFCGPNGPGFTPANAGTANPICTPGFSQTTNLDARDNLTGVGGVSVTFQVATSLAGPFSTVTGTSSLAESPAYDTYILRQITADAMGNADTSFVDGTPFSTSAVLTHKPTRFGVDKTPPTLTQVSGPANGSKYQILSSGNPSAPAAGSAGNFVFSSTDNLSGLSRSAATGGVQLLVSQTRTSAAGTQCPIGSGTPCTQVPYDVGGTLVVPAAVTAGSAGGYYTTSVAAVDAAGNRSAALVTQIVEDATNPATSSINPPTSLTGNGTVSFAVFGTDNLNVTGAIPQVNYPDAGLLLQYAPSSVPVSGTLFQFRSVAINMAPFIQHLQLNDGTAAVPTATTAAGQPNQLAIAIVDAVDRSGTAVTQSFSSPPVPLTGANAYSANFTSGFSIAANTTSVSNCTACGANPSTVTLTATANGTTGVFSNPFSSVQFWYRPSGGGPWHLAGTLSSASVRDNAVIRSWDYALAWNPPDAAPLQPGNVKPTLTPSAGQTISIQVRAIGITSLGNAVASPAITINLTNP